MSSERGWQIKRGKKKTMPRRTSIVLNYMVSMHVRWYKSRNEPCDEHNQVWNQQQHGLVDIGGGGCGCMQELDKWQRQQEGEEVAEDCFDGRVAARAVLMANWK